tara:strand:+ start:305 stop:535 length:231 start_codon:yes stop_codon:yes gene_type:complete
MTNLLFTNKENKEVIANISSISIKQAAIQLSFEIKELGQERVLNAANNTWSIATGKYFLELVNDFRNGTSQEIFNN